jgi:hypothetical protein
MSEGSGELPEIPEEEKIPDNVHVTSYPKIIFLWPTLLIAFVYVLIFLIAPSIDIVGQKNFGWFFIGVFAFNVFVVSFEFSSAKFFLLIVIVAALLIAFLLLDIFEAPPMPIPFEFYLSYTCIFAITYGILWLSRRFNYLEVSTQQISYHVGIMADERRYPAPNCHFEKRTVDVFERIMPPFCAKLVMKQEGGEEAEIMDCVPRINKRLDQIKKILEHLRVKQY